MKRILTLSALMLPLLVLAQAQPANNPSDAELSTLARNYVLGLPTLSYDAIVGKRVVYSGAIIQLFRAPRALELFNPWASVAYGPSDQNLVLDPVTHRPAGLKLFAISF